MVGMMGVKSTLATLALLICVVFHPHATRGAAPLESEEDGPIWRHDGTGGPCAFSPDGKRVAAVGERFVTVLDAASGKPLVPNLRHDAGIYDLNFSADGKRLVT